MGEPKGEGGETLRHYWPYVRGYAMAAIIGLALLAKFANLAKAPFAPSLGHTPNRPLVEEDAPRPPAPPIVEAAAFDLGAEPEAPSGEATLTPLAGGALPASFDRNGRRIVWRIGKPPRT